MAEYRSKPDIFVATHELVEEAELTKPDSPKSLGFAIVRNPSVAERLREMATGGTITIHELNKLADELDHPDIASQPTPLDAEVQEAKYSVLQALNASIDNPNYDKWLGAFNIFERHIQRLTEELILRVNEVQHMKNGMERCKFDTMELFGTLQDDLAAERLAHEQTRRERKHLAKAILVAMGNGLPMENSPDMRVVLERWARGEE